MKRVAFVCKFELNLELCKRVSEQMNFLESENPEFVIAIGGHGTYFLSEEKYPGVPKWFVRFRGEKEFSESVLVDFFTKIREGEYRVETLLKLKAIIAGEEFYCMNDFVLRNTLPHYALRFSFETDDVFYPEVIADGIVISTPYGSTGYYYSITRETFSDGYGIAFNNSVEKIENINTDDLICKVEILRGDGIFTADHGDKMVLVKEGDLIHISRSESVFSTILLE